MCHDSCRYYGTVIIFADVSASSGISTIQLSPRVLIPLTYNIYRYDCTVLIVSESRVLKLCVSYARGVTEYKRGELKSACVIAF